MPEIRVSKSLYDYEIQSMYALYVIQVHQREKNWMIAFSLSQGFLFPIIVTKKKHRLLNDSYARKIFFSGIGLVVSSLSLCTLEITSSTEVGLRNRSLALLDL